MQQRRRRKKKENSGMGRQDPDDDGRMGPFASNKTGQTMCFGEHGHGIMFRGVLVGYQCGLWSKTMFQRVRSEGAGLEVVEEVRPRDESQGRSLGLKGRIAWSEIF